MVMDNIWFTAAFWMGLACLASLISIRTGISVALVEICVGVIVGNLHSSGQPPLLHTTEWTNFLAMLGSGVLTFLAGAEIDPYSLRSNLRSSLSIGFLSFLLPFIGVWLFAQFVLGLTVKEAQICGIALSTTSVAVVYAVMIEGKLSDTSLGKMILAACFITDLGTVLALGILFADYNWRLLLFIVVTAVALILMPQTTEKLLEKLGATRVSEPEIKFILFVLFMLSGFAVSAKSEAVLPAYLLGLAIAGVFVKDKRLVHRIRTIAFAVFTPFYFIKAGLYVSLPALRAGLTLICIFFLIKMGTKYIGVYPLARLFKMRSSQAHYTSLLMATGLTFGTISALFGLQNKIIDQKLYSVLVTVVIMSAFIPTLIAQKFFQPTHRAMDAWGRFYKARFSSKNNEKTSNGG